MIARMLLARMMAGSRFAPTLYSSPMPMPLPPPRRPSWECHDDDTSWHGSDEAIARYSEATARYSESRRHQHRHLATSRHGLRMYSENPTHMHIQHRYPTQVRRPTHVHVVVI